MAISAKVFQIAFSIEAVGNLHHEQARDPHASLLHAAKTLREVGGAFLAGLSLGGWRTNASSL